MKLFIVNISRQTHQFHWRPPEDRSVWPPRVFIPPGQQMQIPGISMPEAVAAVIDSHAKYGLVSMYEALAMKRPTAVAYAIDVPAKPEDIETLAALNLEVATAESSRIREESAAATLAKTLSIKGLGHMRPTHLITEMIEERRDGDAPAGLTHIIDASRDGGPSRFSRENGLGG